MESPQSEPGVPGLSEERLPCREVRPGSSPRGQEGAVRLPRDPAWPGWPVPCGRLPGPGCPPACRPAAYTPDLATIFSSRLIMRSCSCRLCTWRRFCWSSTRRTSRHVSSMARLSLRCSSSMASSSRSFFLCKWQLCTLRLFTGRSSDLEGQCRRGDGGPQGRGSARPTLPTAAADTWEAEALGSGERGCSPPAVTGGGRRGRRHRCPGGLEAIG